MRRFICFIFLAFIPLFSQADDGGHGDKDKDRPCKKERCRPEIHSIEEFGFVVPPPAYDRSCRDRKQYHRAIINFYQWYLNNQQAIATGLSNLDKQKDLVPPFHVTYETLYRFSQLIRLKYPEWVKEMTPDTTVDSPAGKQVCTTNAKVSDNDAKSSADAEQVALDTLSAI